MGVRTIALRRIACLSLFLALSPYAASAGNEVTLALNWVPRADHMPFVFAQRQGWYRDAGIDLTIESLTGSPAAVKRAAESANTLAVADFVPFLREWAKGSSTSAVMVLEPHSPFAVYSAVDTGIRTLPDLAGKRIAAQPADLLRTLWPAFAVGSSVTWVDLANPAKPDALSAGEVDAAFNPFLHNHLNYAATLGERMRVLWWHQAGFPAYGHVLVAGAGTIEASPQLVQRFVAVTKRAWAQCLRVPQPCLDALLEEHPQLERASEDALWKLVVGLYGDAAGGQSGIGAFDPARVRRSIELVRSAYGLPVTGADRVAFTNAFVAAP